MKVNYLSTLTMQKLDYNYPFDSIFGSDGDQIFNKYHIKYNESTRKPRSTRIQLS